MSTIVSALIAAIATVMAAYISRPRPAGSTAVNSGSPSNPEMHSSDVSMGQRQYSLAFILGLISLISWLLPLIGFPIALIGIGYGVKDLANPLMKNARLGLWLAVVGLMFTTANSAIGAYKGYYGAIYY
ncbi:MAG: hypothetical protein ACK40G_01560 [Cytophagaceae bacterium]